MKRRNYERRLANDSARSTEAYDAGRVSWPTCGGLPYDYLPTASRLLWEQAIGTAEYPDERDLDKWNTFFEWSGHAASTFLTEEMRNLLEAFSRPAGPPGVVFDNLPHPPCGDPPTDGCRPKGKSPVSEAVVLGVVRSAGYEVFGYVQEKDGDLVHQVAPTDGEENSQSNAGRVSFGWHTDDAFLPPLYRPENLMLYGLVNELDVPTLLLSLDDDILPEVSSGLLRRLRSRMFIFPAPHSFKFKKCRVKSMPRPVIHEDRKGVWRIALPRSDSKQADPRAEATMKEFRELLDSLTPRTIVVSPGRLLAFSNTRFVHARREVAGARWLQRVYFNNSLRPQRLATGADLNARVFDALSLMR
jgi:L-asparagine oxygenase